MKSGGESKVVQRKCREGMIEISAGPAGRGSSARQVENPYCADQGVLMNKQKAQITITPVSGETRYEVVRTDANGTVTFLSHGSEAEAEARALFEKWRKDTKFDPKNKISFQVNPLVLMAVELPQSPAGFDGPNQPLVNVPGRQVEVNGKKVLGVKEICELQGKRMLTPDEAIRAAGGPQQFLYSSSDGTLNRLAIHSCAKDKTHERGENCPKTTRDVGAGKGHYVSWPQSDGTSAEYFDGNGNVGIWAYENGTYYWCGGSWVSYGPGSLEAGDCVGSFNPEGFCDSTGVRCASSQDPE